MKKRIQEYRIMWKFAVASSVASVLACAGYYGVGMEKPITPDSAQEQCSRDPDAFFDRVRQQAESDLSTMLETRNRLRSSISDVTVRQSEVQEKLDYATRAAHDFRAAWQADQFPVTIHGRAYTKTDVEAQTASLLAQIEGYNSAIAQYERSVSDVREHIQDLTCQIVRTETDLSLLDVKRDVYKASHSDRAAEDLMASVNALFTENATVISASPVRSVDELIQDSASARPVSHSRAVTFLAEKN